VFAPPAVTVIAPAVEIVPARSPAVPAAVLVISEKAGTAPTVGAEVGIVSPAWNELLKLNADPFVA
tara:strand:+ start:1655 stop:1852 length:198 start_codon:yes stop_codon:yes gene_type:complete